MTRTSEPLRSGPVCEAFLPSWATARGMERGKAKAKERRQTTEKDNFPGKAKEERESKKRRKRDERGRRKRKGKGREEGKSGRRRRGEQPKEKGNRALTKPLLEPRVRGCRTLPPQGRCDARGPDPRGRRGSLAAPLPVDGGHVPGF